MWPLGTRAQFFKAPVALATMVVAALALAGLGGCASSHRCESEEVCDGRDNDCDQQTDESFVNADGVYDTVRHCGGCGIACAAVFPGSSETACVVDGDLAKCELVACAEGFHAAGAGACVPDQPVLCLPCTADTAVKRQRARPKSEPAIVATKPGKE